MAKKKQGKRPSTISKTKIINLVYSELDKHSLIRKYMLYDVWDCLFESIGNAIVSGEKVEIRHFGVFMPLRYGYTYYERSYNPQTGDCTPQWRFHPNKIFKCSKSLYRKINREGFDVYATYFDDYSDSSEAY